MLAGALTTGAETRILECFCLHFIGSFWQDKRKILIFSIYTLFLFVVHSNKISGEGIALIKFFERCRLTAYRDTGGVWTIGYGHTKGVRSGLIWTQNQADSALLTDLRKSEGYVDHYVKVPLKQYQFDALVSWTFNLGSGNLRSSTLLKKLNKRLYNEVPKEIERWNKVNGRVLLGLQRRRSAEALLFQGKNWRNYQKYF